ncbi:SusC/RagA family TonB-linked outer membrane protein [Chryseosolibacter indicus]|uniref:TonB-dependent receptor n=1 Tax=Chryseosolibacter indicus TaxID=2782351 RepID=A0ABS5VT86_9BACT|nr:TonB-dependent receptor [Chryseosolibacter indicus]MBT1704032.1 TonB-dependent receptor [Chryseosolibacter indicus]
MVLSLPSKMPSPFAMLRHSNRRILLFVLLALYLPIHAFSQSTTVTGKVTSADDGSGLPGVTVLLKNSTTGTTTDTDGNYRISVPDLNGVLVFSFIGYASQEVSIGSRTSIDVAMSPDVTELNEVVVVGYGTVKKTDLTGSVATIEPDQITKRGPVSALEGVQGQVAGVDISNPSGRAGAGFKVQIRGQQSLKGGNPLYVVDGVITDNIDFLNPQDIERMDILKDASSTAIYGSRGAYGVVIVTTRQGASVKRKATISYDGYYGWRTPARLPDFMDGTTWWNFRQDAYITPAMQNNQAYDAAIGNNTTDRTELTRRLAEKDFTDWPDLLLQTGSQQNHWISASGTSENKIGYTLGVGYQEETGNVINESYKRYNIKANVSHTINDQWAAGANLNLALADQQAGSPNAIVNAFRMSPLVKPYYTDRPNELAIQPGKDLPYIDMTSSVNPLIDMENAKDDRHTYNILGNVYLQYAPVNWLSARSTFAPSLRNWKRGRYWGPNSEGRVGLLGSAELSTVESFSYVWDNQVTANKTFGDHNFNLMGLYSMNIFRNDSTFASGNNLPFNSGYSNIGSAPTADQRADTGFGKYSLMSFAVRLNYSWKDKYFLTLSDRWDGASVLSEGNKWASFPSAAASWKISEELFMSGLRAVNHLAFRVSYGFTGNNAIDPYTTTVAASSQSYYDFGGTNAGGFAPGGLGNRSLTWERTSELNVGVDYSLFETRVTGSVDLYNRRSRELLINRQLPPEIGHPRVWDNVATVRNRGIELALTTINVTNDNLTWSTSFNFTKNKNEILELLNGKQDLPGNKWFIGEPINVNYTYVFGGIWQEEDRDLAASYNQLPGQARVKDMDSDGAITPEDRRIIGTSMPSWTGGVTTTLTFKGFDFSASLFTRQGVQVYSPFHEEFLNWDDRGRQKLNVNWYMPANNVTPERHSNEYPQPKNFGPYWRTENGVAAYRDASFIKVKNITLGYTIPASALERARISSLRIYGNVLNPFVFTDYEGFDPEWGNATYAEGGISSITYQVGVNLKF